ncbi:MAG: metallophosphoesterase [Clostridia bacterium]|nr:metallophosphoesterase [Clostridia bacterium]
MKFLLFADLHYHPAAYASTVENLETILKRAAEEQVDFVIHAGDFCNDYATCPQILKAYLDNPYGLPVYGVYGNHELEWVTHDRKGLDKSNPMERVTPFLTNRADKVVWGTPDGTIGNGSIGYYYFDVNGFRIVCVDTNYSYNEERDEWMHNQDYFAPKGNIHGDCLGPVQLAWLENVLTEAAYKAIPCVVVGHAGFSAHWNKSWNHETVRGIYTRVNAIRKGTVRASINGHYHTQRHIVEDNVLYWDANAVIHACMYIASDGDHYTDEHTFEYVEYDAEGNELKRYDAPYSKPYRGKFGYHFTEPLSAVFTLEEDGRITVDGKETEFAYGIRPAPQYWEEVAGKVLGIPSCEFQVEV